MPVALFRLMYSRQAYSRYLISGLSCSRLKTDLVERCAKGCIASERFLDQIGILGVYLEQSFHVGFWLLCKCLDQLKLMSGR